MNFLGKVCLCYCLLGCSKPIKVTSVKDTISPTLGQVTGEALVTSKTIKRRSDPMPISLPLGLGLVGISLLIVYKWTLPRSRESSASQ